ncbi:MAG TPA: ABC transporter substrate-binding protein, partial [Chthonomonadaceae bacterium]|nr:ABC transporter substrate-binding protein [Chthonomonadaceae bacterium]
YSIERACNPATNSQTVRDYLKDIVGASDRFNGKANAVQGVKVVDPYTVQVTIDSFKPYWLGNLTYPCSYVVCKEAIDKNGGKFDENCAVGTGPFMLKPEGFRRGYQVALTANPDYHDGKPKLDGILRPILKDASTRLSKFEAGELDYTQISPSDLEHVQSDPQLKDKVKMFDRARVWYLALNQDAANSPFVKREVRQAFAYAIDRAAVIKDGLHGLAGPLNGILPPGVLAYNPDVKPIPYDPARAKQLLAQAGYPGGKGFPALSYAFRNDMPEVQEAAEVVRNQLQTNLGVTINLYPREWSIYLDERNKKILPFSHGSWGADYLDPQNFLTTLLHSSRLVNGKEDHPENGVGYKSPEFDTLCDQADVEHDPQKRIALYQQAEKIAIDDCPWVPLYTQRDVELMSPRVQHIRDSLFGHLPHVTTTVTP